MPEVVPTRRFSELVQRAAFLGTLLWPRRVQRTYVNLQPICSAPPARVSYFSEFSRCERRRGGVDARRRVAVWCAWSVARAAMPYFRASLEAAPMVVAPGQAGDIPVAMALLVALVWDVVWRRADEPRPAHLTRRAVTLVGIASTAALVIVEAVLCINRGIPFLGDAQIAVYETIGALEMPLSVFALTGWSIRGVSLRADLIPDESVGQGVPPAGSTSLFVAFTIGALWPCGPVQACSALLFRGARLQRIPASPGFFPPLQRFS